MLSEWIRRPTVQRVLRFMGFAVFALAVFVVVLSVSFPTTRLRRWIEGQLATRGFPTKVEEVSLKPLGGLVLKGVRVDLPPQRDTLPDGTVVETPRWVMLDRLDLSFGIFRALFGAWKVTALVQSGDGRLGPVRVTRSGGRISVAIDGARDFPMPSSLPLFGARMAGVVKDLKGTLSYDEKGGWAESRGRLEVRAEGLRAIKPVIRSAVQGSVALSDAGLGTLELVVNLDQRQNLAAFKGEKKGAAGTEGTVIHVEKAELDGEDVKALFEGHSLIRLAPGKSLKEGQLQLEIAFSLSDAFLDRSVKDESGQVSTPNRFLRTLLSMDPKWRAAQSGNYWGVLCTGTVGRPACIPKRPIVRGGDFRPPEKAQEKPGESGAEGGAPSSPVRREAPAAPASPPVQAVPATPAAPVAPPARAEPPVVLPPAQEAARPQPIETPPQVPLPPSGAETAASAVREAGALKPVILGRSRIRGAIPVEEDEAPGPTGEGAPARVGEGQE